MTNEKVRVKIYSNPQQYICKIEKKTDHHLLSSTKHDFGPRNLTNQDLTYGDG